ncbi:subtilisin-like protease SBT4.14 [Pistacia vera]|uniref:subtilisin-like protease SBT4.14 n=1 Tax=Pistacia vera TaxID=55513 RepID=UPI0012638FC6|nr:subtilisin-like protease SBT4.14 [Pistacia vera]
MERVMGFLCLFSYQLLLIHMLITGLLAASGDDQSNLYVVYLGDQLVNKDSLHLEDDDFMIDQSHIQILASVKLSENEAKESILYSYTKSFNAFAAKLSKDEVDKLMEMDQVLSVYPNQYHKLHTTKSWDFIGLPQTARRNLKVESNIIVGLLDSGITPESESFKDTGFGPPPTKWTGSCKQYANFSGCNNKLIGATYYKVDGIDDPNDILSPVDVQGHGTHTSSTAVGNHIANASLYGLAKGTARGAVPSARVAAYKVCWASLGCSDVDILAGFNAAIHDGVDVISISIGGISRRYSYDSIAIGSFHALKKGIITVAAAGNDGPTLASLSNHAPWLVTIAAGGINRQFRSKVDLGNGQTVSGIGVDAFEPKQKLYPLVNGIDVATNDTEKSSARFCFANSMDPTKVKGKLVYCQLLIRGADSVVKRIGGVGTIVESEQSLDTAQIFMAPGTMVNRSDGNIITSYINSTREPLAVIYKSQELEIPAPFIASFSSRGPNPGSKRILKPDIAAPGVDILASYTPLKSLTGLEGDTQFSKFSIISGTSMACPHVAGVAAYVKSFHPSWSPSAIKSAILTSATPMNRRVDRLAEFSYVAGQMNPQEAVSPGLIYDTNRMGYIQFLCHEGYTGSSLAVIVGSKSVNCSSLIPGLGHDALNYSTMQVKLDKYHPTTAVFRRTVTNVGDPVSIYNTTIKAPKGVNISVKPLSLFFSRSRQKRNFTVVVKASRKPIPASTKVHSGLLVWKSPRHVVRSPIVIYQEGFGKYKTKILIKHY